LFSRRLETKALIWRTTSLIKCTKFGQLIFRKIIKIVVSSAGGAYSAPSDPLAGFKGPTSKGRGEEGKKGEDKRKGKGGEGRGKRSSCSDFTT